MLVARRLAALTRPRPRQEYAANGTLLAACQARDNKRLPEAYVIDNVVMPLLNALSYLHKARSAGCARRGARRGRVRCRRGARRWASSTAT